MSAGPKRPRYKPASPMQALAYLIEECGETLAAAGKAIRWGGLSVNPELKPGDALYGETNYQWLGREMADLDEAMERVRRFIFHRERRDSPNVLEAIWIWAKAKSHPEDGVGAEVVKLEDLLAWLRTHGLKD